MGVPPFGVQVVPVVKRLVEQHPLELLPLPMRLSCLVLSVFFVKEPPEVFHY